MVAHLGNARNAVFLPYALHDYDAYTASAQERRYDSVGITLHGLHTFADPIKAIAWADAIIAGGGNSFHLVGALHELGLIEPVRRAVDSGVPYFGASAGANVACPTIRTTNDMPIVEPVSLSAFGLVPFQINPHYVDPPPAELQIGETREQRIAQFLEENMVSVVGLREQSWLRIGGSSTQLRGAAGAVLFRRGCPPQEITVGADLSFLFDENPRYDQPDEARQ